MFIFKSYGLWTFFRSCFPLIFICIFSFFLLPIATYAEETDEVTSNCSITKNITHKHTGNSTSGGGCYGKQVTGSKQEEIPCGGTLVYYSESDTSGCDKCGAGYSGNRNGESCPKVQVIENSYTYYELNCKKNTTDILGTITLTKNTSDWTRLLELTCSYENPTDILLDEQVFIWNGTATEKNTLTVSENGLNKVTLNILENPDNYSASVSIDVDNIDYTPPHVSGYSLTPDSWTKNGVTFHMAEISDLQPDHSEGAGLPEFPFSYDNGSTWCAEDTYFYTKNGTYAVMVRDAVGNISKLDFNITWIDTVGPDITSIDYNHANDILRTTLSVSANDIMEDGSAGVGLHEIPFSFDNGKNWTDQNFLLIDSKQKVQIAVRDRLENITYKKTEITNIFESHPIKEEESTETSEIVEKEINNIPKENTEEVHSKEGNEAYKKSIVEERIIIKPEEQTIQTQPSKNISEQTIPKREHPKQNNNGFNEILFLISVCLILCIGLSILGYLWYHSILVYNEIDNDNFERIGRQWIRKKEGKYEVNISDYIYSQGNTTHFSFRPSALFLIGHRHEEIFFFFPGEICINLKAEKEMKTL